ncbi:hypothetical protein UT300005_14190 [Clostridium sp. CTA-5]
MSNLKHTKIGISSFILTLTVIIFFSIIIIRDILFPISFSKAETSQISTLPLKIDLVRETLIITAISFSSFILGIISIFQKGSKKILPKIAIIISGLFLIPVILGLVKGIFLSLTM